MAGSSGRGAARVVVVAALIALACGTVDTAMAGAAKPKEFDGFGKAKFGMSPKNVERLYPKAQKLDKENLGASVIYSPLVARHLLVDQKLPGLKSPVRAELRYWKERLWVIVVYWGENSWDDVKKYLAGQLGDPPASVSEPFWRGEKTQVTTDLRTRWYAIADKGLSKEAQLFMMEDIRKAEELRRQRLAPAAPESAPPPAENKEPMP